MRLMVKLMWGCTPPPLLRGGMVTGLLREGMVTGLLRGGILLILSGVGWGIPVVAQGQPITPAPDGTETRVIPQPISDQGIQQFNIDGGRRSANGANLFHSLQSFGLSADQVANFLSSPGIENILTRVVGGQPSLINGLIQVTGGNSHLFLMNPAGVVFGTTARLNVPASFLVTTATGMRFGDQWWNITGTPNYSDLVGTPNGFQFSSNSAGIVNQGQLSVSPYQNLTLLGGSVINTGSLTAPGGQITVAAIPGENVVRISQPGFLLSLEVPAVETPKESANSAEFSLPELLTGGGFSTQAQEITVNDTGQIILTGAGQTQVISAGTTLIAGTLDTTSTEDFTTPMITILGDRVTLDQATVNVSSVGGAGVIKIGGDLRGGNPDDLRARETYISVNTQIQADAWETGNGGQVTIWSDEITRFHGQITARGADSISPNVNTGGFVEVSGTLLEFKGEVDTRTVNGISGTLLLDPENIVITDSGGENSNTDPSRNLSQSVPPNTVIATSIAESELEAIAGNTNLLVEARGNIRINDLSDNLLSLAATEGHTVTFRAGNFILLTDFNDTIETQGGNLTLTARSLGLGGLNANGGTITLIADGIDLLGGVGSVSSANGQIQLQPRSVDREIRLGALTDDANALDLTLQDLSGINRGFEQVIIGSQESQGTITVVQPLEFQDPIQLQTPSGMINVEQSLKGVGNSEVVLNAETISLGANITTENQEIRLDGDTILRDEITLSTGIGLGDVNFNGTVSGNSLTVTAGAGTIRFDNPRGGNNLLNVVNLQADTTEISNNFYTRGMQIDSNVNILESVILDNLGDFFITNPQHKINTQGHNLSILGEGVTLGQVETNGGNLILTASDLKLQGGVNSVEGAGGIFQIQPRMFAGMNVGGNAENLGILNFNETNIQALADGWKEIRIGGQDTNSIIRVSDPVIFTDPVVFQSTRLVVVDGEITGQDNSSITIEASGTTLNNQITTNDQPIRINSSVELGNNITLDAGNSTLEIKEQINGSHQLRLNASRVQIDGEIGDEIPLRGLEITADAAELPNQLITDNGFVRIDLTENLNVGDITTNGGELELKTETGTLTAGTLNTSGNQGGNILLMGPDDIEVESIQTGGGNLDITTEKLFRATQTLTDIEGISASLSTAGTQGAGSITLRHGGGNLEQAFEIGNSESNGTAGALNAGQGNQINPPRTFPGSFTQGTPPNRIEIITFDPPETPPPSPMVPVPDISPSPVPIEVPSAPEEVPEDLITDLQGVTQTSQEISLEIPFVTLNLTTPGITQVLNAEQQFSDEYEKYLGLPARPPIQNLSVVYETLRDNEEKTGIKSAIIYINFLDQETLSQTTVFSPELPDQSQLTLVIVTANGQAISVIPPQVTRQEILQVVRRFHGEILNPRSRNNQDYLTEAQQLYQWLISPLIPHLERLNIQNLVFIPPAGLRSLPFAALHDGNEFLVEQYSLSMMPSLGLTDTRYTDIRQTQVLAMGASQFENKPPLYAVPLELSLITENLWPGRSFLNQAFTLENLQSQRVTEPFEIIHLATHADFQPGDPENSYIQLWDQQLDLKAMQELEWNNPPVKLLVLSACSTALGDRWAELGFAGLAVNSGARSVLATLWAVSDQGTLALMSEFYRYLRLKPIKAVALQEAQKSMINNQIIIEGRTLRFLNSDQKIELPPQWIVQRNQDFSHPFYWAGFTLIGNPW